MNADQKPVLVLCTYTPQVQFLLYRNRLIEDTLNKQVAVVCSTAHTRALSAVVSHRNPFMGYGQGVYSVPHHCLRVSEQRQTLINIVV